MDLTQRFMTGENRMAEPDPRGEHFPRNEGVPGSKSGRRLLQNPRITGLRLLGQGKGPGLLDRSRRGDLVPRRGQVALSIRAHPVVNLERQLKPGKAMPVSALA